MRTIASNNVAGLFRIVFMLAIVLLGSSAFADADTPAGATSKPATIQTRCPVMDDLEINPNIYSDYQGQRVYFCCLSCKADFDANPGNYLGKLPQFATSQPGKKINKPARPRAWMRKWIEPTGATTLVLLIVTVCLALLRRVRWPKPGAILKLHKIAGLCALCCGLLHATMVLLH